MTDAKNRLSISATSRSIVLGVIWLLLAVGIAITQLTSGPSIEIAWKTASEFDTAGFNIYRSDRPDEGFQRINDELIHGTADTALGADYIFVDQGIKRGVTYYYRLEDVEYDNSATLHEIIPGRTDYFEKWALLLIGACLLIGISFLIHAIRSKASGIK
jgi:hypothetical protein